MLFIVILVESPASHWGSLNSQKIVRHTGGPHFPKGVPIFLWVWGSRVPILLGKWGPGSLYSREYGDPGPHFPGSMGTRDPHFGGSPFSHDTGMSWISDVYKCRLCMALTWSDLDHRRNRNLYILPVGNLPSMICTGKQGLSCHVYFSFSRNSM